MNAPSSPADALLALLARERAFLLTGELAGLSALSGEKLRLTDLLVTSSPQPRLIRAISRTSQHNARLIAAAIAGLKATRQRLNQTAQSVTTYDQSGRKSDLSTGANPISRA
jgi:hypothetical protein